MEEDRRADERSEGRIVGNHYTRLFNFTIAGSGKAIINSVGLWTNVSFPYSSIVMVPYPHGNPRRIPLRKEERYGSRH